MAVLSRERIIELLSGPTPLQQRLVVSPILEPDIQIGDGSIDVRLGNYFIVTKTARIGSIQPFDPAMPARMGSFQEVLYVPFTRPVWIHPGTFVLGGTFEYIRLPSNLCATVTARSSWARLGLNIATAVAIHPGFYGCLTLELVNNGNTPVAAYPGSRIGQLTILEAGPPGLSTGTQSRKYEGQITPGYSGLSQERSERTRWKAVGEALRLTPPHRPRRGRRRPPAPR